MKLSKQELKNLFENAIDDKLMDNTINYYYEGMFVPALITEEKVVFYSTGRNKFYISDYKYTNDGIIFEGLRKLSLGGVDEVDEQFENTAKGIFEIDEDKSTFDKSLKKMKRMIESNEIVLSEDVFIDRMKGIALGKAKTYLQKSGGEIDNWNADKAAEFKSRMAEISNNVKKGLLASVRKPYGQDMDSFYSAWDVKNVKFSNVDGKGLYKQMEIKFPSKDQMFIAENEDFLKKKSPEFSQGLAFYSSAVDDTAALLKKKKYVEDEEKNPTAKHINDFLGAMKSKENVSKFWKDKGFKSAMVEMYTDKLDVNEFINRVPVLNLFAKDELKQLVEKTLLNIFEDGKKISEAKDIAEALYMAMTETGTRENYVNELLGVEISNVEELINENDIGQWVKEHRNPEDLSIIAIKNLAETITDYIARYKETDMSMEDMKLLESTLFKLNDIWMRQRITNLDRKFVKTVIESLMDVEKRDMEASEKIVRAKDEQRDGINAWENDILKKNSISKD